MSYYWLKLIVFAILDVPLTLVALWYGRSKPYGSDPNARRALYGGAALLWVSVVLATVLR
jgi:hypothetical protein